MHKVLIMKRYIIYMHIFPNGKKYIGMTSKKPNQRWEGGTGYTKEHQPVMYNAIQKYGWENVKHEILYRDLTYEEALDKEMELIAYYKTNCKKYGDDFGYNMTDGGDGNKGHTVSKEHRQKLSKLFKGKTGSLCCNSKPVICDGVRYASLTEFKTQNNVKGAIHSWLNGTKGMPKEWYDKGLRYVDRDNSVIYCQAKPWSRKLKYDNKIFNTQRELAEYLGVSAALICKWDKKGLLSQKGIERIE